MPSLEPSSLGPLLLAAALLLAPVAIGCSDDDNPSTDKDAAAKLDTQPDSGMPDQQPPDLGKLDIYNNGNFGALCTIPVPDAGPPAAPVVVHPKASDCDTGFCLHFSPMVGKTKSVCSGPCTVDEQCPQNTDTCPGGFVCGLVTGNMDYLYPCCRMCLCRDFVASGSSPYDPASCDGVPPSCPTL